MSVTVATQSRPAMGMVLRPQTFSELNQFAAMAAKSQLVPKDYQGKPENIVLAVQMGSEVGLAPMQALQNIAVINGRPAVWGDAMIGLVRGSSVCKDVIEKIEGEGDNMVAVCTAHRVGSTPVTAKFSVADAKKAGLWTKQGPWTQYPTRMLQLRARGFALRDAFPDVLRGLISAEEARDIPADDFKGPTIDVTPSATTLSDAPKKPTLSQWFQGLRDELDAADSREEIFAIISRDDVQSAFSKLSGDRLVELEQITQEADDRFPPNNDAEPGSSG